jgi:hypothetical protein
MVPWDAGRAEEHMMDDVQPGKIANRIGHFSGSHVRVAPVTGGISEGVGRSLAIRMTRQTIQGESRRWTLQNMAKVAASAGTTVGREGRVYSPCEQKGHRDRRCVDTYPGQCCVGGPWGAGEDSGTEGTSAG